QSTFFEENEDLLQPLIDYFEDVWVSRARTRGRRASPQYPLNHWNCFQSTGNNLPRTNNNVEGWNHRFNMLIGAEHPTIWKLIKTIQTEQGHTEFKHNQLIAGVAPRPKSRKYKDLAARLLIKMEQWSSTAD